MVDNAPPSRNSANDDTLTGAFREILKKSLQNTDDMLPARVISYDRTLNIATVQPLIQVIDTNQVRHSRPQISNIPVLLLGGGEFFVSFNLPVGSIGWIKSNDRDISLFLQSYSESAPDTQRLHSFDNSIFIPDVMTGYTIDPEDDQAMVIQNLSGSVRISLNTSRIKMTTPQLEVVTGSSTITVVDGQSTITATENIINGNLQVNGTVGATGNISSDADVLAGSISLNSHTHAGSPTAPSGPVSNTGGPQ